MTDVIWHPNVLALIEAIGFNWVITGLIVLKNLAPLATLATASLTFTCAALSDESHHQRGALVTLSGSVERLHHKLMGFRLNGRRLHTVWLLMGNSHGQFYF